MGSYDGLDETEILIRLNKEWKEHIEDENTTGVVVLVDADADSERNDAEWVKESVIEDARESGVTTSSGAWLARPVEGKDRVDVYRFDHSVDVDDDHEDRGV